jgi:integrase
MRLNKTTIDRIKYEGSNNKKHIVWDDALPSFGCRIYPSGKKAFVFAYRYAGRKRLMVLGRYGLLTVDQARKKAKKLGVAVSDGVDPMQLKREELHGNTVSDLCEYYLEQHAKKKKKSWKEDQRRIQRYVKPALGKHLVKTLARVDVAQQHRRIGTNSPYEANRILALLSVMFEFAINQGFREESAGNPAKRIEKWPEQKRDRWATREELSQLVEAINQEKSIYVRGALWMYLLTGARKSEVLTMRWTDLDLSRGTWRQPETKAGRTHYLSLSPPVVQLLREIPKQEGNPYVICGHKESAHLVNIDKAWRRVRKSAGVEDLRLHDLRRTVGSWLAQSGNSLHLIGRVLGHSNASTTQIYAHFAEDHVRMALDKHAQNVLSVVGRPNGFISHDAMD